MAEAPSDPDRESTLRGRTGLLVAFDETAAARRAAAFAAERAAMTGEFVTVVHIGSGLTEADVRAAVETPFVDRQVTFEVAVVPAGGSDHDNVSVPTALHGLLRDNEFAMVVLGNERHDLFHGLTEASVSEALVDDQDVPVLLVP
jgi:nucleotide-binding universal stress UspA family protein